MDWMSGVFGGRLRIPLAAFAWGFNGSGQLGDEPQPLGVRLLL